VSEPEAPIHKPATLEEIREALMAMLHQYFVEGQYHIEVMWDKNNGGIVKLLIQPMAEWQAEQEKKAQEDGSGFTPTAPTENLPKD
jgi:septum formation topological specificity factor MinE